MCIISVVLYDLLTFDMSMKYISCSHGDPYFSSGYLINLCFFLGYRTTRWWYVAGDMIRRRGEEKGALGAVPVLWWT
jgi:hypothetical protein